MHPLGEQLSAGRGEFHIGATLVHPEPASLDRQLYAGPVFGRRAAFLVQEGSVDFLDVDAPSCTASTELAISISLRAAASGSVKWLGSTYFMGG